MSFYGPFISRRLGWSLGLDLLPVVKTCTFDCIYCELGCTPESGYCSINHRVEVDQESMERIDYRITTIHKSKIPVKSITLSGNGEPTLVSNIGDVIDLIQKIKKDYDSKIPVTVFTNASTIHIPEVQNALAKVDTIIAKLDTTEQDLFEKINKPHNSVPTIDQIIGNLKDFKKNHPNTELIIQTMLISGRLKNFEEEHIYGLVESYEKIKPDKIFIYTIARPTAVEKVWKVRLEKLEEIRDIMIQKNNKDIFDLHGKIDVFGPSSEL
ncbi:MAG: radical SAM protein [Candidatus Lokiarchaeota archaeon]|nr:radical SAM protein [Candidatus Lokiarchaeota archaeon]